jgi:transcriptional regulator with PAS, ATPase and Fis domain
MKAGKGIFTESIHRVPYAAAIINQEYFVIYANRTFTNLLNLPSGCYPINAREVLSDLKLGLIPENQVLSPQEITIPRSSKKYEMFIRLLDILENGEHHYLIYIKNRHPVKEQSLLQRSNPFITKEEIHVESLLPEFNTLIGQDTRFKLALVIAQRAAKSDLPVLIHGESGTGKENLARAIHQSSLRNERPLMDINCAAIPDTLIESEFFGYEKGAFTGANTGGRTGYFDQANKGTIFLDEIGDTSLMAQAKLLRVLEDGCFKRVGGSQNIKVDVRVISATNKDLTKLITENKFREDLFYRLNAVVIYVPPLRERPKDIRLLIDRFLKSLPDKKKRDLQILPSTMDILLAYHWPGNVRELKGVVNYAANMTRDSTIPPSSLPSFFFSETPASNDYDVPSISLLRNETYNLAKVVDLFEKNFIKNVLATASSKTEAIKTLKISRRAFYLKLNKFNLK